MSSSDFPNTAPTPLTANSVLTTPTDKNFLSASGHKFTINMLPNFTYYIQSVDMPDVVLGEVAQGQTPFSKMMIPGDHLDYGDLTVTFKVDEDMKGYFELYNWLRALGYPDGYQEYGDLYQAGLKPGSDIVVDGNLIIMSNLSNPNISITFNDMIPKSLSGFKLDSTLSSTEFVTASATFRYRTYTFDYIT